MLQLEDGATQLKKLIRLRLGKDLQQDVSEHYKRFLHRSARLYQQSMQHYIAEESNLLTGFEQVFVFGVAGKSHTYNHIANALRETWCNDDRFKSHDIALSQQLQGCHLAGGVHWTGEEDDWQETDYDYEDSLEPWTSEWYDTDGRDDESHLEETDWTEDFTRLTTTILTTAPSPITILHCWPKLSKHKKEIRANMGLYKKK